MQLLYTRTCTYQNANVNVIVTIFSNIGCLSSNVHCRNCCYFKYQFAFLVGMHMYTMFNSQSLHQWTLTECVVADVCDEVAVNYSDEKKKYKTCY